MHSRKCAQQCTWVLCGLALLDLLSDAELGQTVEYKKWENKLNQNQEVLHLKLRNVERKRRSYSDVKGS